MSGSPSEIPPLHQRVASHGGTTSITERLPSRLQTMKDSTEDDVKTRLEDLTRANGSLHAELRFYQESDQHFRDLRMKVLDAFGALEEALCDLTVGLDRVESDWLRFWGIQESPSRDSVIS